MNKLDSFDIDAVSGGYMRLESDLNAFAIRGVVDVRNPYPVQGGLLHLAPQVLHAIEKQFPKQFAVRD